MKIYRFRRPYDLRFADAGRRGTWGPSPGVCPECGASRQERISPLQIVFEPGSDVAGDFVWSGPADIVVKGRVYDELRSRFTGFEAGAVEVVDGPVRRAGRRTPRVPFPYSGPPLVELKVTTLVRADRDRSSLHLDRRCGTCGTEYWSVTGVETMEGQSDDVGRRLYVRTPRKPGQGLFVRAADLAAASIFRARELPAWVLCTQDMREFVEEHDYTNVTFLQIGEVF